MNRFKEKELRYVRSRLHLYSRQLIDFCVQHQAGTLMLMNQESKIKLAKEEEFVLRNWSYYDLITKIKYKAKKAGIELDRRLTEFRGCLHTSQGEVLITLTKVSDAHLQRRGPNIF